MRKEYVIALKNNNCITFTQSSTELEFLVVAENNEIMSEFLLEGFQKQPDVFSGIRREVATMEKIYDYVHRNREIAGIVFIDKNGDVDFIKKENLKNETKSDYGETLVNKTTLSQNNSNDARLDAWRRVAERKNVHVITSDEIILVAANDNIEDRITHTQRATRRIMFLIENRELLPYLYKSFPLLQNLYFSKLEARTMSCFDVLNNATTEKCTLLIYLDCNYNTHIFSFNEWEQISLGYKEPQPNTIRLSVTPNDLGLISIDESYDRYKKQMDNPIYKLARFDSVEFVRRLDNKGPFLGKVNEKAVLVCCITDSTVKNETLNTVVELTNTNRKMWEWVTFTLEQLKEFLVTTNNIVDGVSVEFESNAAIYNLDDIEEVISQKRLWCPNHINEKNDASVDIQHNMRKVCDWLWESDTFNMWNKSELVSLAYTIERMHQTMSKQDIEKQLLAWHSFARMKLWPALAETIAYTTNTMLTTDLNIKLNQEELSIVQQKYEKIKKSKKNGKATFFGIAPQICIPDWFQSVVSSILEEKKAEVRQRFNMAADLYGMPNEQRELVYNSMYKMRKELLLEMDYVLKFNKFKEIEPISVFDHKKGVVMTAKDYYDEINGYKTVIGAYLALLLTMNDNLSSENVIEPQELTQKRPMYIYRGESQNELVNKLLSLGNIDWSNKNETIGVPFGVIEVNETDSSWISQRKAFMGWNVIFKR